MSALFESNRTAVLHRALDTFGEAPSAPRVLGTLTRALFPLSPAVEASMDPLQHELPLPSALTAVDKAVERVGLDPAHQLRTQELLRRLGPRLAEVPRLDEPIEVVADRLCRRELDDDAFDGVLVAGQSSA